MSNEPTTTGGMDPLDRRTHLERLNDTDPFPAQGPPPPNPTLEAPPIDDAEDLEEYAE